MKIVDYKGIGYGIRKWNWFGYAYAYKLDVKNGLKIDWFNIENPWLEYDRLLWKTLSSLEEDLASYIVRTKSNTKVKVIRKIKL